MPNPGTLGLGAVLYAPTGEVTRLSRLARYGDSTVAEYLALIMVLEQAALASATNLIVYGDSRVVIDDMLGTVPVQRADCAHYRSQAQRLMSQFISATLIWIPRAKNGEADALARHAFSQNYRANV